MGDERRDRDLFDEAVLDSCDEVVEECHGVALGDGEQLVFKAAIGVPVEDATLDA